MSYAQFVGHFLVAVTAFGIGLRQSSMMGSLMRLRRTSRIAIPGFFFATAAEQASIGLQSSDAVLTAVTLVQFTLLLLMMVSVSLDARRAVLRFSNAVSAIIEEFDGLTICEGDAAEDACKSGFGRRIHVGSTVLATINHALFGEE